MGTQATLFPVGDPVLRKVRPAAAMMRGACQAPARERHLLAQLTPWSCCPQAVFERRKAALLRHIVELSSLCECDVALMLFTKDGDLVQYSPDGMESILRRYSRACDQLHESFTMQQVRWVLRS